MQLRYKCKYCHRAAVKDGQCGRHPNRRAVKARETGGRGPRPRRPRTRRAGTFTYGPEWAKLSARYLAENPWCIRCANKAAWRGERRFVPAEHTDHIVPVAVAPGRVFDDTNFQPLCGPCHSVKTARERKGECVDYARGVIYVIGADGVREEAR